jgi:hypothetical protein
MLNVRGIFDLLPEPLTSSFQLLTFVTLFLEEEGQGEGEKIT